MHRAKEERHEVKVREKDIGNWSVLKQKNIKVHKLYGTLYFLNRVMSCCNISINS